MELDAAEVEDAAVTGSVEGVYSGGDGLGRRCGAPRQGGAGDFQRDDGGNDGEQNDEGGEEAGEDDGD